MKHILIVALALATSASFCPAVAAKKDKKKADSAVKTAIDKPVSLKTSADSLSYAAGAAMTNGLLPFLKQQYGVDEVFMDDFIDGFNDAMERGEDPKQQARDAGAQIAHMVNGRMLPAAEADLKGTSDKIDAGIFRRGFVDALRKDTTHFDQKTAENYFRDRREAVKKEQTAAAKKRGADFLAANATKDGVKTTASGLQYKVLNQGTGAIPTKTDEVKVNYEGRLIDGKVFDSSYKRGEPATFKTSQVIKGWTEALTMMPVGSKWELYIPENLAYGEHGAGADIGPCETLIFTVELLDIVPAKTAAKPAQKAAKPAQKTAKQTVKTAGGTKK